MVSTVENEPVQGDPTPEVKITNRQEFLNFLPKTLDVFIAMDEHGALRFRYKSECLAEYEERFQKWKQSVGYMSHMPLLLCPLTAVEVLAHGTFRQMGSANYHCLPEMAFEERSFIFSAADCDNQSSALTQEHYNYHVAMNKAVNVSTIDNKPIETTASPSDAASTSREQQAT